MHAGRIDIEIEIDASTGCKGKVGVMNSNLFGAQFLIATNLGKLALGGFDVWQKCLRFRTTRFSVGNQYFLKNCINYACMY